MVVRLLTVPVTCVEPPMIFHLSRFSLVPELQELLLRSG